MKAKIYHLPEWGALCFKCTKLVQHLRTFGHRSYITIMARVRDIPVFNVPQLNNNVSANHLKITPIQRQPYSA